MDQRLGVHYGSIVLFSSILHNVFLLYHVEMFVSVYRINKVSFWLGEVIFLVWNSCNDPLFGWFSDKKYLSSNKDAGTGVVLNRLRMLSWTGPLFALSFLGFWISWELPSIQFVLCLCLYDSFLTMVDLHHSALLADLAVTTESRTSLNYYCSFFGAMGSLSVFLSYAMWQRESLIRFQLFCAVLTFVSIIGFFYSTRVLRRIFVKRQKNEDLVDHQ